MRDLLYQLNYDSLINLHIQYMLTLGFDNDFFTITT
jgi:hypothetical protein